ncbi:MAG: UDP-2,4-diacetamido-2,4,6-trideoxy-beta-L-altropyranose hydrolase [Gemmatimonas sp.]
MKVAIRTDASPAMGMGHLMRCLTLADALRAETAEVTFLSAPMASHWSKLVQGRGHRHVALDLGGDGPGDGGLAHAHWLPWGQQADAGAAIAALGGPVEWLIVDHYALDARWETAVRPVARRVLVIDDLADRRHACDVLVDHNPQLADRYDHLVERAADRLLGPRFALLRPEFAGHRARRRDGAVERTIVFMSGTDPNGSTLVALAALSEPDLRDLDLDVVIGQGSPHLDAVTAAVERRGRATLHIDAPDIAALFAAADLAVGSGGVAALERCCLGLPSITIAIADNQKPGLGALRKVGAVAHLGDLGTVTANSLADAVRRLRGSRGEVQALAEAARSVVDGQGTSRVVAAMQGRAEGVAVRRATMADAAILHGWRNAEAVRAASFSSQPIAYADHCRWLEQTLADPNRIVLLGTLSQAPVGTVRYDIAGDRATVSIVVAPDAQGRGIGTALLGAGEAYVGSIAAPVRRIDAEIKPDNHTSLRLFARAGFSPAPSGSADRMLYVKTLSSRAAHTSSADA